MSRDADEPRTPGRPGPKPDQPIRPKSKPRLPASPLPPTEFDENGPSTFRPNPVRAAAKPPTEQDPDFVANPERAGKPRSAKKVAREPTPASGGPNLIERIVFGRVSTGHLAQFCRQFGSYLD